MVNITIDGLAIQAAKDATILQTARENGIEIPTLCHNEALGPEGRCRLCMVEIKRGTRTRMVTSCLYPVEEGLEVQTATEKVLRTRKIVVELLRARNPESEDIRKLAAGMGVETPRFKEDKNKGKCILCGLCVKSCAEAVGVSAIGLSNRGSAKKVGPPYAEPTMVCIGCGACHYVCPTGHIQMKEKPDMRSIWGRDFPMQACKACGKFFAPAYQLEWMAQKTGQPLEFLQTCQDCRK
jgi:bidirectional [NiFe] hydrogenase diaphorase subunit